MRLSMNVYVNGVSDSQADAPAALSEECSANCATDSKGNVNWTRVTSLFSETWSQGRNLNPRYADSLSTR